MSERTRVKAVAATGQLGTGFLAESLEAAVIGADFIGCDAGSTDPGPYYLGSGRTQGSQAAVARDTRLIIEAGLRQGIPVLIGSAGTAGARPQLEWMLTIVRELAREHDWHFSLAAIDTELNREYLLKQLDAGRITPLHPAPVFNREVVEGAKHIVAMAGSEPFQQALKAGAQVVVAGRTTDTSIFAAVPISKGIPRGVAWHAGKILECGSASVEQRLHPDSMIAELDEEGFTVYPPNPRMRCTPTSVASHTLYENADPYRLVEPGGTLDTSESRYQAVDERAVRVTGSRFVPAEQYTVRLEGATLVGYRSVAIGGIRDPLVLRQLDGFLEGLKEVVAHKVGDSLQLSPNEYEIAWRVYGRDASMGPLEPTPVVDGHEVGVLIDIVARSQRDASAICSIAWHTALHHPIPEYSGLISNLAFPYSPPGIDAGPVYRFCVNHVLALDDPCEPFPIRLEDV